MDESNSPRPDAQTPQIIHVTCPRCECVKAVVAHTHFHEAMCFCPVCEHVWDCDASSVARSTD